MTPEHAKLIAQYCNRPELEAALLDERLSYWAMHEAEKTLPYHLLNYYVQVMLPEQVCATAAERAEAFLKTIAQSSSV